MVPNRLRLDLVLPPEHVVDVGEVVSAVCDSVGASLWRIALLQMGLLPQQAHLDVSSQFYACLRGQQERVAKHIPRRTPRGLLFSARLTVRADSVSPPSR